MIGICKLCKRNSKLLRSHIIPEFFYEPLYDQIHRGLMISTNPNENLKQFKKVLESIYFVINVKQLFPSMNNMQANYYFILA